jgi:hypothetical protein
MFENILNAAMTHYAETNVGGKKVKNLTPRDVVAALLTEYAIMHADKSPFCQTIASSLRKIPIEKQDGSTIVLDVVMLWCEFFSLFQAYESEEFAIATFGSMYGTRIDSETVTFDPNYHISGKEAFSVVDETAFTKLFKMWNFLMSEMFYRFFYTYDFRTIDTEYAYYTVLGDASKKKRTSTKFCEYLLAFRPLYAEVCMFSPEKREIYSIFTDAAAHAKHLRELKLKKLAEKRAKKSPVKPVYESHAVRIARLDKRLAELDIIMGRAPGLEKLITPAALLPPAPKSVWMPLSTPAPPAPPPSPPSPPPPPPTSVEQDDGFTPVVKVRRQPKPELESHTQASPSASPRSCHQKRSERVARLA